MYATPLQVALAALPPLTEVERNQLVSDPGLSTLQAAFACVPDPRAAGAAVFAVLLWLSFYGCPSWRSPAARQLPDTPFQRLHQGLQRLVEPLLLGEHVVP